MKIHLVSSYRMLVRCFCMLVALAGIGFSIVSPGTSWSAAPAGHSMATFASGTITADPNPITVCDGSGLGVTTLFWTSTGTIEVEVRVGSYNGALFAHTGPSGSWPTGKWVVNGTVFYLQDVSHNRPLAPEYTLATVTVNLRCGTITADPNPINVCDGSGLGVTTLFWTSTGTTEVEVRVGSPTGALFAHTGPSGSWTTGKWVVNGTVFYLQDVSHSFPLIPAHTIGTVTVNLSTAGCGLLSAVGQWSQPIPWNHVAIHMSVLPNGKVISWDSPPYNPGNPSPNAQLWDPATGAFTSVPNPTTNLFCSGHSLLPDGRLIVTGGHRFFNGDGVPHTNIFDYQTNTWTRVQDMNLGRWYPTNCALGNGETVVISGYYCSANCQEQSQNPEFLINDLPQVWHPVNGWRSLTDARLSAISLYPWLLLAPNGKAFYAGPEAQTRFLNTAGTGSWSNGQPSNFGYRDYGSCVMYGNGKLLIMGGGADVNAANKPTNTAEVIDLTAASQAWRFVNPMAYRRRQAIATILADGKVLVTGGTSGAGFNNPCDAVRAAEIWDPATEAWTTVASATAARIYHLTAVLLPDGRVLSAGSTLQSPDGYMGCATSQPHNSTAEIYSPPYLFNTDGSLADRPVISSGPSAVTYGQTFFVQTAQTASIAKVTWIRLSSVTHSFNQNQRINQLTFTKTIGGLHVTAPSSSNLCSPGDYMLFILNSAGVPSVAKVVRIQ